MKIAETVEKALKQLGITEYKGGDSYFLISCPFWELRHKRPDRNPSFYISLKSGYCKCFSCGIRFSLSDFLDAYAAKINSNLSFENLFFFIDFQIDKEEDLNVRLSNTILNGFKKNDKKISSYLFNRGIDTRYLNLDLYYDEDYNNIVCPVKDYDGFLVGASGRFAGKNRIHHHYFGLLTSKALLGQECHSKNQILVVEGLTDYLNCKAKINELNLDFDVYATLTNNLDDWQARELIDLEKPIYLCWDQDTEKSKRQRALKKLKGCVKLYDCEWSLAGTKKDGNKDIGDFSVGDFQQLFNLA